MSEPTRPPTEPRAWVTAVALAGILVAAAALRLTGQNWDHGQHLHPDERYLTLVTVSLRPVKSVSAYFDTPHSTLNPANVGNLPDYVYGTFPVILLRLLAGITHRLSYAQVHLLGRSLAAGCDLLVVLMVYFLGAIVGDRRVGLLAAAFGACVVLQIQLAHYFTVDSFANLFTVLALLVAVRVAAGSLDPRRRLVGPGLLFGLAAGAATAAKLSAAPVALLLPVALTVRALRLQPGVRTATLRRGLPLLAGAAAVSLLTFRVLQPYAFAGPGFLGLRLDPRWLRAMRNLAFLSGPDADWPPAMQWARRSVLFSGRNMLLWGLGPALGVLAWAGFAWAGTRLLLGGRPRFAVLWLWVAGYFTWQSLVANPTMRYQLPVYPALTVLAAWAVVELADRGRWVAATAIGVLVLGATGAWATAFAGIYTRPMTRVAASEWILHHLPGPINLESASHPASTLQVLSFPSQELLAPWQPYWVIFRAQATGETATVTLHRVIDLAPRAAESATLTVTLVATTGGPASLAAARIEPTSDPGGQPLTLRLDPPALLRAGSTYRLDLAVDRGAFQLAGSTVANESRWDDGLPLPVQGGDPCAGVFQCLTFEMYSRDDAAKGELFASILDQADLVVISSNRQWGSVTRLPERFPLTSAYYRALLGCPSGRTVVECYTVAQPGRFSGQLGFDLVQVFESPPSLGPLSINDQWAEEAFTVYDHPKVLLFARSTSYSPERVRAMLGVVDLAHVVQVAPGHAGHRWSGR